MRPISLGQELFFRLTSGGLANRSFVAIGSPVRWVAVRTFLSPQSGAVLATGPDVTRLMVATGDKQKGPGSAAGASCRRAVG
jgi:hypothetical protein